MALFAPSRPLKRARVPEGMLHAQQLQPIKATQSDYGTIHEQYEQL